MSTSEQGPDVIVGSDAVTVLPEFIEHARTYPNKHPKGVLGDQVEQPERVIDESDLATGEN